MAWLVVPACVGWSSPACLQLQFSCCCTVLQEAAQARHAHDEHQRLEREHQHCLLARYRERRECEAEQAALEDAKEAALQAEQAGSIQQCNFILVFVALQNCVCVIMSRLRLHCCHMAVERGVHGAISWWAGPGEDAVATRSHPGALRYGACVRRAVTVWWLPLAAQGLSRWAGSGERPHIGPADASISRSSALQCMCTRQNWTVCCPAGCCAGGAQLRQSWLPPEPTGEEGRGAGASPVAAGGAAPPTGAAAGCHQGWGASRAACWGATTAEECMCCKVQNEGPPSQPGDAPTRCWTAACCHAILQALQIRTSCERQLFCCLGCSHHP